MVLVTLLWSIAGVVTRQLETARSFEVTFWRSFFTALSLVIGLGTWRGRSLASSFRQAGGALWVSGFCWGVMFTAFMVALTLTSVAYVLVTMALGPVVTALSSRLFLKHRLSPATWMAIFVAASGVAVMFGGSASDGFTWPGVLMASCVPLAGAANWTVLQRVSHESAADMLPAVLIGALLSCLFALPLAWPLQASVRDIGLLATLGAVQLAIPCLLVVILSRYLMAAEISLLALLEVVFGVAWAWLWAGERPAANVLLGGCMVLLALAVKEASGMRMPGETR